MKKFELFTGEKTAIVLMPDSLCGAQEKIQALWLIAPEAMTADVWLEKTAAGEYAETAKAILICAPGVNEDSYYKETLWDALHEKLPALSCEAGDHRLLGVGESGERCLKYVFRYPEQFKVAVAVSPVSSDGGAELLSSVQAYQAAGRPWPRAVISDCAEGAGKAMGEAINAFGVGLHIHAERPVSGWELMDMEIKSCLAHL